jgi:hypothetical protein
MEVTFRGTAKRAFDPSKAADVPFTVHALDVDEFKGDKWTKASTYANGLELMAAMAPLPNANARARAPEKK